MTSEGDTSEGGVARPAARGRWLVVLTALTPAVALATFAIGLRVGAAGRVRAAVVRAAPPPWPGAALAWQVQSAAEEQNVREMEPLARLEVTARRSSGHGAAGARTVTWRGPTNDEGVAEVRLEGLDVAPGDTVALEVESDDRVLARGDVTVPLAEREAAEEGASDHVRAVAGEGPLAIAVALEGQRISTLGWTTLRVRVTDRRGGTPRERVRIEVEPELGLVFDDPTAQGTVTCANGWAELRGARATSHLTALRLRAKAPDGAEGSWYGALPSILGAPYPAGPSAVREGQSATYSLVAPPAAKRAYVELRTHEGRAAAWTLSLAPAVDGQRAVTLTVEPSLLHGEGPFWLATASDANAAASFSEASLFRPLFRAEGDDLCARIERRARAVPPSFALPVVLDGFDAKRGVVAARRNRGLTIALGGLFAGAVAEGLLIGLAVRGAREAGSQERGGDRASRARRVVVAVLLAVLGYLLFAAIMLGPNR